MLLKERWRLGRYVAQGEVRLWRCDVLAGTQMAYPVRVAADHADPAEPAYPRVWRVRAQRTARHRRPLLLLLLPLSVRWVGDRTGLPRMVEGVVLSDGEELKAAGAEVGLEGGVCRLGLWVGA